ncbi:MAG: PAS domain S-box protein, partial [Bacteroidota bacterium]
MKHATGESVLLKAADLLEQLKPQNGHREPYQLLFERSPLPMWIYDLETFGFLEVNEAAVRRYGYSREEFLSMTIKDIRPVEDLPRLEKAVEKVRSLEDLSFSSPWKHIRKDGTVMAVEITGFPLQWNRRPAELVAAHDIAEQFEVEMKLRSSRASLKSILESSDQAIWSVDRNFRYSEFNECFKRSLLDSTGKEPKIGCSIDEVLPAEEAEFWKNQYRRALRGEQFSIEFSNVVFSDVRHYKVTFTPVVIGEKTDAVTVFSQDITEFKRSGIQKESLLNALKERVKELRVLHNTGRVLQRDAESLPAIFQAVAELLPDAWQYPGITAARILFDDKEYCTANYADSLWRLQREFITSSGKSGCIEVVYLEERPDESIGPFLNEEKELLDSLGEMIRVFLDNRVMKTAIRESEQRYRHLIENSTDVVVTTTPEGVLTYTSPSIARILGYSENELIGRRFMDFIHPEDQQNTLQAMEQIVQGAAASISIEVRVRHKDQHWIWVESAAVNMLEVPSVRAIVGNFRDITDRKNAVDELTRSREWFKTIFEASRDGIVVEEKEIIVYANSAFGRL